MNMNSKVNRWASVVLAALGLLVVGQGCGGGGGKSTSPTAPGGGTSGNHAPTLNVAADSTRMYDGSSCAVRATASDVDGDQLTFTYQAVGGSVTSSGPTATSAIFTPTRFGNDSVRVTVVDGHGGQASASAVVYFLRAGPPSLLGTRYSCSWRITTVPESLFADAGWCADPAAMHDVTIDGNAFPVLLVPGKSYLIEDVDPCNATQEHWHIVLRRPLPDGRTYDVALFGGAPN